MNFKEQLLPNSIEGFQFVEDENPTIYGGRIIEYYRENDDIKLVIKYVDGLWYWATWRELYDWDYDYTEHVTYTERMSPEFKASLDLLCAELNRTTDHHSRTAQIPSAVLMNQLIN